MNTAANDNSFMTIRQVAKSGPLSEHYLRLRLKQGCLPGFYIGTRFMVDYEALIEMLHQESKCREEPA